MRRFITTLGLIWVLCVSLLTTACPKDSKSALEDGFVASVRASSYTTDLTNGITKLYRDGAIPEAKFRSIIGILEKVVKGGTKVHDILAGFVHRYPDGNIPPGEFKPLTLLFNSEVYGPIIQLAAELAGLSPANQALLSVAMLGLKAAVGVIKRLMDKHSAILGLPPIKESVYA